MTTTVVNLNREPYDVYCGRAGKGHDGYFGNPYRLEDYPDRDACIHAFRVHFLNRIATDEMYLRSVLLLRDKRLGCFCKPKTCHADVIAAWVDSYGITIPDLLPYAVVNPFEIKDLAVQWFIQNAEKAPDGLWAIAQHPACGWCAIYATKGVSGSATAISLASR